MVCSSSMNRMILALLLREIVEHRLHPLLEFAPKFRPGDQRAHVERQEAFALESFRDLRVDDPLGETLDDCGLSRRPGSPMSTGLFLVRRCRTWMVRRISSSRPMTGSSLPCSARSVMIDGELLQRPSVLLRVRVGHGLAAPDGVDGLARSLPSMAPFRARSSSERRPPASRQASTKSSLEMNWSLSASARACRRD